MACKAGKAPSSIILFGTNPFKGSKQITTRFSFASNAVRNAMV